MVENLQKRLDVVKSRSQSIDGEENQEPISEINWSNIEEVKASWEDLQMRLHQGYFLLI